MNARQRRAEHRRGLRQLRMRLAMGWGEFRGLCGADSIPLPLGQKPRKQGLA